MFRVKVNEDEYSVSFAHDIPSNVDYAYYKMHQRYPHYEKTFRGLFGTRCDILDINNRGWSEWSDLSIHDQFNRSIGRKVSLTKALQSAFPGEQNKPIRKLFWDAYYKARNEKW